MSDNDFVHEFENGKSVTLPRFKSVMTFGRARKLRGMDEAEQMFSIIEDVCSKDALAVLDEMDSKATEQFFTAWQKDSDTSLGESSGSSS